MSEDKLSTSLQESILTLLTFNNEYGAGIATIVTQKHFDESYREIAGRVLRYWEQFSCCPGEGHIDDIFDDILENSKDRRATTYRGLLMNLHIQSKSLNAGYVFQRAEEFVRRQVLKSAIMESATRYQTGGDGVADDVEQILYKALRNKSESADPGVFLNDEERATAFLRRSENAAFPLGIRELDYRGLCPTRKEMFLFMAPRKKGKSWAMIHAGKRAILVEKKVMEEDGIFIERDILNKVLHITLEMSETQVCQRYFQNFWGLAKRIDKQEVTTFHLDGMNRLTGFGSQTLTPAMWMNHTDVKDWLHKRIQHFGTRLLDRLLIKQFPTKSLTVSKLKSYLDMLESVHKFIPDMIIVDYPDLMWTDEKQMRQSLGRVFEELRGIGVDRNAAMVVASQSNRKSESAKVITSDMISEDISKVNTCDVCVAYSQTEDEKPLNLARLFVAAARNDEDKFTILIRQNYKGGQFCLGSVMMPSSYFDTLKVYAPTAVSRQEKGDGDSCNDDDEADE